MIVLFGGEKGGTGKTTIAVNVAATLAKKASDVAILDTDPQLSATGWAFIRNSVERVVGIEVVAAHGDVTKAVKDLARQHRHIIIDAGGRDSAELRSALVVADKIYTPVRASQFDVASLSRMDRLVAEARTHNKKLRPSAFINCAATNPRVNDTQHAIEFITMLEHFKFSTVIKERAAFRKTGHTGLGVLELTGKDYNAAAAAELTNLCKEIFHAEV